MLLPATHKLCQYLIVFSEVKKTQVQPKTIRVTKSSGRVLRTKRRKRKLISEREDEVGWRVMRKSQTEGKNKGVNTENEVENGAKQENYLRETV